MSSAVQPDNRTNIQVGQTRCYWALLNSALSFVYVDPTLNDHLGEQASVLLGKNLLYFVHPDEQESARQDLGGVLNSRVLHGSATRVRFSRLSRVRRLLGYAGPAYPWQDAEKIAVDENYMVIDVVINYAAEDLVLCFLHAFVDLSPNDNNLDAKGPWTNWCGTPSMPQSQIQHMYEQLVAYVPARQHADRVFQILANTVERRPLLSWPPDPPPSDTLTLTGMDFSSLAANVDMGGPHSHTSDAKTSCTRRYKQSHALGDAQVESIFIPHGSVIFACHKVEGPPTGAILQTSSVTTLSSSSKQGGQAPGHSSSSQPGPSPTNSHNLPNQPQSTPFTTMGFQSGSATAALSPPSLHHSYSSYYDHHAQHSYSLPPISSVPLSTQQQQQQQQQHQSSPSHGYSYVPVQSQYQREYNYAGNAPQQPSQWNAAVQSSAQGASGRSGSAYWQPPGPSAPPPHYVDGVPATAHEYPAHSASAETGSRDSDGGGEQMDLEIASLVPPPRRRVSPAHNDSYASGDSAGNTTGRSARGSGNRPSGILKCSSCKTTQSPEWRKGPSGKKELCNACGLRYARSRAKKEGYVPQSSQSNGGSGRRRKSHASSLKSRSVSATPSPSTTAATLNAPSYSPNSTYAATGTPPPSGNLPPMQPHSAGIAPSIRRYAGYDGDYSGARQSPSPPSASANITPYGSNSNYYVAGKDLRLSSTQGYSTSVPSPLSATVSRSAPRTYNADRSPTSSGLGESFERGEANARAGSNSPELDRERARHRERADREREYEYEQERREMPLDPKYQPRRSLLSG